MPMDQNTEADSITNGDHEWLGAEYRVVMELEDLPFLMLHSLLEEGASFYDGVGNLNAGNMDPELRGPAL